MPYYKHVIKTVLILAGFYMNKQVSLRRNCAFFIQAKQLRYEP